MKVVIVLLSSLAMTSAFGGFNNFFNDPFFNTGFNNNGFGSSNNGYGSSSFNSGFGSSNTGYGSNTNTNTAPTITCPTQTDLSADLDLSPDDTNYPVTELNAELVANPQLAICLSQEIVDPTLTTIAEDPIVSASNNTCPSTTTRLFNYAKFGNRCWVIPGFQEDVNYTACVNPLCQGCDVTTNTNSWFGSSSSSSIFGGSNSATQRQCIRSYRYVYVWSLCLGLTAGQRIIRDRIILPFACNCQQIRCTSTSSSNSYGSNSGFFWK